MAERDPEVIRQEIAAAREQLASTVDSLADRANPQRVADDVKQAGRRFVRRPAVTASLVGAGALIVVVVISRVRRGRLERRYRRALLAR